MNETNLDIFFCTSDDITEITKALIIAQTKIKHAIKDAQNPHLKNTYATLESVIDAVKHELLMNDIVIIQAPGRNNLITRLQHKSGQYFQNTIPLIYGKQEMQGLIAAVTYGRRASLVSLLNIAQADDDGTMASQKGKLPKLVNKPNISATFPPKKNDSDF